MAINNITHGDVMRFKYIHTTPCKDHRENMMNGFQRIATQNAKWPGKGTALGLIYVAGKLAGEAGELTQQPFKAMRDDDLIPVFDATQYDEGYAIETPHRAAHIERSLTPERRAKIIKEAGGVLWYLAALATELNMSLSDIALANLEQLADRTERGTLQGDGDDR